MEGRLSHADLSAAESVLLVQSRAVLGLEENWKDRDRQLPISAAHNVGTCQHRACFGTGICEMAFHIEDTASRPPIPTAP